MNGAAGSRKTSSRAEVRQRPFLRLFISPAALVAAGFVLAMGAVLQYAFLAFIPGELQPGGFTFRNFAEMMKPLYAGVFYDTAQLCFLTAVLALLAGYPLALALVRARNPYVKSAILIISVTPLFLGEVIRTYAWIIVLGNRGFVNGSLMALGVIDAPIPLLFTRLGVVVALVHVTLPVVVIMLAAAIAHIDRDLERAAAALGARPPRVFWTVTLPLSMPGIIAGLTTGFAWTFSAFATPQLIGGGRVNMVSNLVYSLGFSSFNFPFAAALSVAGLVLTALALAGFRLLLRPLHKVGLT